MIYPTITLYQPWATWIIRGWKTIETRTHSRFSSLEGKTILIHAGKHLDSGAYYHNPYLTLEQMDVVKDMSYGCILGSAVVKEFRFLTPEDAPKSMIECYTQRYGLILGSVTPLAEPIPAKGQMGIWYFDLDKKEAVKKPVKLQNTLF